MPDLTIVIPTRNSQIEKHFSIAYCLKALEAQTGCEFEVILVSDGSTDQGIAQLPEVSYRLKLAATNAEGGNVSRARNLGARLATADAIVFMDDDTFPLQSNAFAMTRKLIDDFDFTCGAHRHWTTVNWFRHVNLAHGHSSLIRVLSDLAILPRGINRMVGYRDLNEFSFIGSFGAIRKETFFEVGGFDERFLGWGMEDVDLLMRLILEEKCYALLCELEIGVLHLTHPRAISGDYERNMELFQRLEIERGYFFHVNHFFRVYEGDGWALLSLVTGPVPGLED